MVLVLTWCGEGKAQVLESENVLESCVSMNTYVVLRLSPPSLTDLCVKLPELVWFTKISDEMETHSVIIKERLIDRHDLIPLRGPESFQFFIIWIFHLEIHILGTVLLCAIYGNC